MTAPLSARIALRFIAPFALAASACAGPEAERDSSGLALPDGTDEAVGAIEAEYIEKIVRDLSDDSMEGRGPGTDGDRKAQQYLVDAMESFGLEPGAGDGRWRQPFEIVGVTAKVPESWSFGTGEQRLELDVWDDFIAASGVQSESAVLDDAEVVFVGYGIQAPEHGWDDFKDADLRGKVLLIMNNDPDWDPELFEGSTRLYYGRWTYKYESAARAGAAGAIIIHTTPSAGYPWQVVQTSWTGEQFELPWEGEPRVQVSAWATEDAARQLVSIAGFDLEELRQSARTHEFEPVPLGVTTSLELSNTLTQNETANVLGLLPGSDEELADEVVVYTAHYDHLGRTTGEDGEDTIYNGALDNAAGVSMVLATAKALTTLPERPRRSILFAMVGAEEQGLLGSRYYSLHPTFPAGRIAANVNLDGGNPWGKTSDVAYVGFGKSTLDEIAVAAAALQDRTVTGDQFPDRGYFYRSDQFSFAKIGVPAFYMESGTTYVGRSAEWGREVVEAWTDEHYHQPSDEVDDSWTWEGLVEDASLAFYCGLAVAEASELPSWNAGDEFEAARKDALSRLH